MISYDHKFIFIHIYKNAGSSIRAALLPQIRTPIQRAIGRLGRVFGRQLYNVDPIGSHATAKSYQDFLGAGKYATFFSFAFVRNPWDWQVSLYSFMKKEKKHFQHDLVEGMSFDEYIDWRCATEPYSQKGFVADSQGRIIVNYVGRFESINADFERISRSIGISAALPYINASRHEPYREFYTPRTKKKIAQTFAEDIELFGYDF